MGIIGANHYMQASKTIDFIIPVPTPGSLPPSLPHFFFSRGDQRELCPSALGRDPRGGIPSGQGRSPPPGPVGQFTRQTTKGLNWKHHSQRCHFFHIKTRYIITGALKISPLYTTVRLQQNPLHEIFFISLPTHP